MSSTFTTESDRTEARNDQSDETKGTVLQARDLRVTYDMARGRARVLDDVSVEIKRGETLAIVGESGAGKSTFGSVLMDAVEEPGVTSGELLYYPADGEEPINVLELDGRQRRQVRWEEISMVTQAATNSFNPTITVRRHFRDTFDAHGVPEQDGFDRARDIFEDLNLDPDRVLDAYQDELSGGEKQRAMLALSLVFDPEVLILDEPTAGLDLVVQQKILSMLYEIKDEYDLTMIFITHDIPIVAGFADRIGIMYAFDFVEFGDARDVLLSPDHPYTRLLSHANLEPGLPLDEIQTIDGEPPDAINVPPGCPFHPRCPVADDRCEGEVPELRAERGGTHEVACFYPDAASREIPVAIGRRDDDEQ